MLNWLLSVATGGLLILIFPRFNLAWLAPFALTPLLIAAAREPRAWRRFLMGWASGIVFWFGVCYWIQFVLSFHGGLGDPLSWAVFMLFCLAKGLPHMAVFTLAAGILIRRWSAIPAVAALWVAIEVTHGPLGFAWLALGNAGIDMGVPLRLAPLAGVYGISFVFASMSVAIALIALRRPRTELLWLAALPFLIFLSPMPAEHRGQEPALLVQPNISETEQWTTDSVLRLEEARMSATLRGVLMAGQRPPEIVVWPEEPAPLYYYEDAHYHDEIDRLAQAARAYLLIGTVARSPQGAPLNSALLVSPQGKEVSRYDKVNLVPFGEFVPWPFGSVANTISTEAGNFERGKRVVVSPDGHASTGHIYLLRIGLSELCPPVRSRWRRCALHHLQRWLVRQERRARTASFRSCACAPRRTSRWILRAANDGITATVDPAGRVLGHLPLYEAATSYTSFNFISQQTLYTRFGDWFPALCTIIALAGLIGSIGGIRMPLFRRSAKS